MALSAESTLCAFINLGDAACTLHSFLETQEALSFSVNTNRQGVRNMPSRGVDSKNTDFLLIYQRKGKFHGLSHVHENLVQYRCRRSHNTREQCRTGAGFCACKFHNAEPNTGNVSLYMFRYFHTSYVGITHYAMPSRILHIQLRLEES